MKESECSLAPEFRYRARLFPSAVAPVPCPLCLAPCPTAPLSQTCGLSKRELSEVFPTPWPQDVLVYAGTAGKATLPILRLGAGQPVWSESSPPTKTMGQEWKAPEASSCCWSLFPAEQPDGFVSLSVPIVPKGHSSLSRPLPGLFLPSLS